MSASPDDIAGLVSVILPTYNRAQTLARAMRSVLAQTYEQLELIVVDDGSTDSTLEVVEAFDDPRIRYAPFAKNRGASAARNEGLRLARGEFIAFQDSDDEWMIDKLAIQVATARAMKADKVAVFHMKVVYGRDENRVYGDGRICCVPLLPDGYSTKDFIRITHQQNLMSPQTLMFSRACLPQVGEFDPLLRNSVDWDFSIRLVYSCEIAFVNEPLVMTYIQPDSISIIKKSMVRSQLRILLKLQNYPDVDRRVLSDHFGRIGMNTSRLGKRRAGAKLIRRSIGLHPGGWRNWGRLAAAALPGRR